MRRDGSPSGLREALASGWKELALYVAAGVIYVVIGVAAPEFMFPWAVAVGFLLVCVVVVPYAARRALRRAR